MSNELEKIRTLFGPTVTGTDVFLAVMQLAEKDELLIQNYLEYAKEHVKEVTVLLVEQALTQSKSVSDTFGDLTARQVGKSFRQHLDKKIFSIIQGATT